MHIGFLWCFAIFRMLIAVGMLVNVVQYDKCDCISELNRSISAFLGS